MTALARRPTRRYRSHTCGQTIRLAVPVSSSRVMNVIPLAVAGPLSDQNQPGDSITLARLSSSLKRGRGNDALSLQATVRSEVERMAAERQPLGMVVMDHFLRG